MVIPGIRDALLNDKNEIIVEINGKSVQAIIDLSRRHREILAAGGLLNWARV